MKNKIIAISALFAFLITANIAGAQNNSANLLQDLKQKRDELRTEAKNTAGEIKENTKQTWQDLLQATREQRTENRLELIQKAKELIGQKRETLKEKLQVIKDAAKKQILERVYNNLNKLNESLTTHYANLLNQIETVLGKIENRAKIAKENGKDVTSVETAIVAAKNAIAASRTSVDAQAKKVYEIQITTESALHSNAGAARKLLYADLAKVRQTVVAAHKAVKDAAVQLAKIAKIDELKSVENQ